MSFKKDEVCKLLVDVHRRCCICHRFCGVKIETDHIEPKAKEDNDRIDNAIPVCFECHSEIHSYNDKHPRGRKFSPKELHLHKAQWLRTCRNHPELFVSAARVADVGPLQALIDELEFNLAVSEYTKAHNFGALFADEQFRKAIAYGAISTLEVGLKQKILHAYAAMSRTNQRVVAEVNKPGGEGYDAGKLIAVTKAIEEAAPTIREAHDLLLYFLSPDGPRRPPRSPRTGRRARRSLPTKQSLLHHPKPQR